MAGSESNGRGSTSANMQDTAVSNGSLTEQHALTLALTCGMDNFEAELEVEAGAVEGSCRCNTEAGARQRSADQCLTTALGTHIVVVVHLSDSRLA